MKIEEFALKYLKLHIRYAQPSVHNLQMERYEYQKKLVDFNISSGDKVLDIGSGHNPFPLATHLADLYEGDTTHRSHEALKTDDRPFTVCGIEDLPFEDNEFDYVYASHILEHVDNPAKACAELQRVAKKGYIETPTKMTDIMLNHLHKKNHHRWSVSIVNNTIIFIEYTDTEKEHNTHFDHFYNDVQSQYQNTFQDMYYNNFTLFYNMYQWNESFNCIVINKEGSLIDANT